MFQHTDGHALVQLYIALVKELVREYVELIQNKYKEPTEDAIDLQSALTLDHFRSLWTTLDQIGPF